jgi:hypothetical protein
LGTTVTADVAGLGARRTLAGLRRRWLGETGVRAVAKMLGCGAAMGSRAAFLKGGAPALSAGGGARSAGVLIGTAKGGLPATTGLQKTRHKEM